MRLRAGRRKCSSVRGVPAADSSSSSSSKTRTITCISMKSTFGIYQQKRSTNLQHQQYKCHPPHTERCREDVATRHWPARTTCVLAAAAVRCEASGTRNSPLCTAAAVDTVRARVEGRAFGPLTCSGLCVPVNTYGQHQRECLRQAC